MSDAIQVGDVFEPTGGKPSDGVEVTALYSNNFCGARKIGTELTFTVAESLLLDPLAWVRAGYMGTRYEPAPLPAPGNLTVGMARKVAKWRPSLVPSGTMEAVARAMQAGIDAGHVEGDWRKREAKVFVEAAIRHLLAELGGETVDESGLAHLDHALASVAIARHLAAERGP